MENTCILQVIFKSFQKKEENFRTILLKGDNSFGYIVYGFFLVYKLKYNKLMII